MRDPKRIPKIIGLIKKIWTKYPDLRLTQLVMNVLAMNKDPYYVEDDILYEALKTYDKTEE